MKAVILAAGEGTRLRPFTNSRPKVMLPIGNRPILEYVVNALVANGVRDLLLVVGYKKERIMSHFGDGSRFGANIRYIVQDRQLGTAHALTFVKEMIEDRFLVLSGDNIIDKEMVSTLLELGEGHSVLVTESNEPSKYGVVLLKDDRVVSIEEKPRDRIGNIINTGLYSFEPDILPLMDQGVKVGQYGITQVLRALVPDMHLRAALAKGEWDDAVYPWDLVRLNEIVLENRGQAISGTVEPGVTIKGSVQIGKGTRVRSGTYIEGPVIIGEGCDIGPSSCIFPSTSIGDGVSIEPFVAIKNCVIMNNVVIGGHSHLCQSVVDDNVRLGPGFSCYCGAAYVHLDDGFHNVPKIGCMIGDESTTGARVVISPGCIIGQGCRIGDGAKVSVNVENRSTVI